MKLKNSIFADPNFNSAITSLNNLRLDIPVGTFVKIIELNNSIEKHQKIFEEARKSIIEKYGEKFEGNFRISPEADPLTLEAVNTEFKELTEIEFNLEFDKIPFSKKFVGEKGLRPVDVLLLKDFIDMEEVSKKTKSKKKKK